MVKMYVEGGGDSKEQHARCREGFCRLLEKSGFSGRMPRIVAGGGRGSTFDRFKTAIRVAAPDEYPILLVDSEETIQNANSTSWAHLKSRDNWDRPNGAANDQAQLMTTCMETWIMADRAALSSYFGIAMLEGRLIPVVNLETRHRHDVQDALVAATRNCKKTYTKGERSFEILAELHPETLRQNLPHFQSLIDTLEAHL